MALTAYTRVKLFWGALEAESGYGSGQTTSLGASAVATGGIGVRRVQLVFARAAATGYSEDTAVIHFDFMNYTGGNPDDSWITADFTSLEANLATWWTAVKPLVNANTTLREYRWYRIGAGVGKPNPAARVQPVGSVGTGVQFMLPPQVAMSVTFKTGLRKRWGRTYLPSLDYTTLVDPGRIANAKCDVLANATNTLFTSAAANDFQPVVYSPTANAAYSIESVQVDNVFDIIRRRRWDSTTYRKTLP